jgi:transcriptional regulator with XRE-family HTH domain
MISAAKTGRLGTVVDGELGQFLRIRRESVSPADVGLPTTPRRRTPGLRRAELATLAGISVDYLVRLEQGRDRHPSAQVLAALAEALRMNEDDLAHLRRLATVSQGTELCPTLTPPARAVRPTVRTLLERLEPAPALVLNGIADVLAWTQTYERLAGPLGILDSDPPNLIRYTLLDERARDAYPDWAHVADEQVANLRSNSRPDPVTQAFVVELTSAGAEFTRRWDCQLVAAKRSGVKRIVHPDVGELRLAYETLQLPDADDQRLVVYLAHDEATSAALDVLAGRQPGALHAVRAS